MDNDITKQSIPTTPVYQTILETLKVLDDRLAQASKAYMASLGGTKSLAGPIGAFTASEATEARMSERNELEKYSFAGSVLLSILEKIDFTQEEAQLIANGLSGLNFVSEEDVASFKAKYPELS